jgi:hypothetical protein
LKLKLVLTTLILTLSFGTRAEDCVTCPSGSDLEGLPSPSMGKLPTYLAGPKFRPYQKPPITIHKEVYERNTKATFCTRPVEMVDTLVIHHSETTEKATALDINEYHLERGTAADPWYMIGYSWVVNAPYPGNTTPVPKVTEGRPLELVGSHAGSNIFLPMDSVQKQLWEEKKILCGREGEHVFDPSLVQNGKIKANVTTAGIVINGNYSPYNSRLNPNGYRTRSPRIPTPATRQLIAELSCQLQKQYPRMKNIKWHSFYHSTSCPGTIKSYIEEIKKLARGLGCEFN